MPRVKTKHLCPSSNWCQMVSNLANHPVKRLPLFWGLFASCYSTAPVSKNSPSTLQKTDSISPIPFRCLAPEVTQGSHQASVIRRGNRLLIHKDNATVPPLFFSPTRQRRRNRPPIVGDQRQSPLGSF